MLDGVVTSAEAGARKPSAAIFERALGLAGVGGGDAIHIGDSLEEDVAGARAAGIEPVLLRRDGATGPTGIRTIASLTDALR
jgi:putative hydrolase of the HAD superfamily